MAQGTSTSIARHLAHEVVEATFDDIPASAVERIKRGILDNVGIAFFDHLLDDRARRYVEYAKEIGSGIPEATLIGDGTKVSSVFASGVNAQMAASTDFHETGPGLHALPNLVQTGIAVAERVDASGQDLITAVALAYDINGRFARAAFPLELINGTVLSRDVSFPGHQRHYAATAAITAAKLLGLDESQVAEAIAIAWHYAGLPKQWYSAGVFDLGACGWGIQAAMLADRGCAGLSDVVENETAYDLEAIKSSPSPYYYPSTELHLKPWVSSRGIQPGLSATLDLLHEKGIEPDEVESITFRAKDEYLDYPFTSAAPRSYMEIINSVPWAFAMAILGHQAGPAWLADEQLDEPAALSLAAKVKIEELQSATDLWNTGVLVANEAPNEVVIVAGGETYVVTRTYGETPGSSLNPMPEEWLEQKFKANAVPVIGIEQSEALYDMLSRLTDQPKIRDVADRFGPRNANAKPRP